MALKEFGIPAVDGIERVWSKLPLCSVAQFKNHLCGRSVSLSQNLELALHGDGDHVSGQVNPMDSHRVLLCHVEVPSSDSTADVQNLFTFFQIHFGDKVFCCLFSTSRDKSSIESGMPVNALLCFLRF